MESWLELLDQELERHAKEKGILKQDVLSELTLAERSNDLLIHAVLEAKRGKLLEDEVNAVLDVMNGCNGKLSLTDGTSTLGNHIAIEIEDADRLNDLGLRWQINALELARKIRMEWSQLERTALELWCSMQWAQVHRVERWEFEVDWLAGLQVPPEVHAND